MRKIFLTIPFWVLAPTIGGCFREDYALPLVEPQQPIIERSTQLIQQPNGRTSIIRSGPDGDEVVAAGGNGPNILLPAIRARVTPVPTRPRVIIPQLVPQD